jgi:hypothetical protein
MALGKNNKNTTLSIITVDTVMLSVIMLNVRNKPIFLSISMLSVICAESKNKHIMLSFVLLSVVMLSVFMLTNCKIVEWICAML